MITVEKQGRRWYLRNAPFSAKDTIKDSGGKWDPEARSWYVTSQEKADKLASVDVEQKPTEDLSKAILAGTAEYKGKSYYVAGRIERGRTHWDDTVRPIRAQSQKLKLISKDGKITFWAEARITKSYSKAQTIDGIRNFVKSENRTDTPTKVCWECGCTFTKSFAHSNGGDWNDSYCGC